MRHGVDAGEHWRNPANTIELFVCGDDAAFCQMTLTTCFFFSVAPSRPGTTEGRKLSRNSIPDPSSPGKRPLEQITGVQQLLR